MSLADAKTHLRVDITDDDTLITAMVLAATEAAEQILGRALMPQTWQLQLDAFPEAFELTRVPVISVANVQYVDATGATQTLASNLYALDNANDFGFAYLVPAYGSIWPATRDQINAVSVQYVCGYANAAAVPESIKAWIKLQVGAMYENRASEGAVQTYALGFADRLLDRYTIQSV